MGWRPYQTVVHLFMGILAEQTLGHPAHLPIGILAELARLSRLPQVTSGCEGAVTLPR